MIFIWLLFSTMLNKHLTHTLNHKIFSDKMENGGIRGTGLDSKITSVLT